MERRNKYSVLGQRLAESGLERVQLSFEELDELCTLPPTAYSDRPFWANTWRSNHARSWLRAGYIVENVSLGSFVVFLYDPMRAKNPGAGRKGCAPAKISGGKMHPAILRPCPAEMEKYLQTWDELEDYPIQEVALDELFSRHCPQNRSLSDVLLKVAALNTFYSTNIFSVTPVARHILELDIDSRLAVGDLTLVEDIRRVEIKGREKDFYSFATKYCSHHVPDIFPIYDSYVRKMLCYFRDTDGFFAFRENELKDYPFFKGILTRFQKSYGLEEYSIKDVDKYLWQVGRTYFPNSYGKGGDSSVST